MERFHGSCQCGAVDFDASLSLEQTVTCNCSRCRRLGIVLAFAQPDAFTLNRGEEALAEYLFNKHIIRHRFCTICGIQPFAMGVAPDGSSVVAVNVNCLDGVDPRALPSTPYDGAAV